MSVVPSGIVQNLRMPGQEFDLDTGLYHNGFRDYVPGWGRYLESDPIGLAGGLNTYAYANGNPVSSIDPSGLCSAQEVAALARIGYGLYNIVAGWSQIGFGGVLDVTIPVVGVAAAIPFEAIGAARVSSGWINAWGGLIQAIDAYHAGEAPVNLSPPIQIQLNPQPLYPGYEPVINVTPAVGRALF